MYRCITVLKSSLYGAFKALFFSHGFAELRDLWHSVEVEGHRVWIGCVVFFAADFHFLACLSRFTLISLVWKQASHSDKCDAILSCKRGITQLAIAVIWLTVTLNQFSSHSQICLFLTARQTFFAHLDCVKTSDFFPDQRPITCAWFVWRHGAGNRWT